MYKLIGVKADGSWQDLGTWDSAERAADEAQEVAREELTWTSPTVAVPTFIQYNIVEY